MDKYQYSRIFKISAITFILLGAIQNIYALRNQFQIWPGIDITGKISDKDKWKYNFDFQPRFVPSESKHLERIVSNGGAGYRYTPELNFWIGGTFLSTNRDESSVHNREYRLWQRVDWNIVHDYFHNLTFSSQLEQRKDVKQNSIGLELREKFQANFPYLIFRQYKLIIYDEVFFNLTKTQWISPKIYDRNRAFLGMAFPLNSTREFRIGYLNQYEIRPEQNKIDNILLMSLDFNFL